MAFTRNGSGNTRIFATVDSKVNAGSVVKIRLPAESAALGANTIRRSAHWRVIDTCRNPSDHNGLRRVLRN